MEQQKLQLNYAINGQTGKVTGERPYSYVKIAFLVLSILMVIGGALYLEENPDILNSLDGMNTHLNIQQF